MTENAFAHEHEWKHVGGVLFSSGAPDEIHVMCEVCGIKEILIDAPPKEDDDAGTPS